MNWKLLLLIGVAWVGLGAVTWWSRMPGEGEPLQLTILHTNDVHAHYDAFEPWGEPLQGGVARLKTAVDGIRETQDNVVFLDAGDQFQGTLFFTVGGAEIVAEVMNELEVDAMCLGNHEFDAGPAELARFIDRADFPVLSANTDALSDPDLSGKILPYTVAQFGFERDKVAVIGLTTESTAYASSPGPTVRFLDVVSTAQRMVDEIEATGIDVILALTHLGYRHDLELARSVDGIDVIVGGHSHTRLDSYPTLTESATGEPVLVVTAYAWGKQLGRLEVLFNEDGLVTSYAGAPEAIKASIPEDPGMVALLDRYRPRIEALMTTGVGSTEVPLEGAREDVRARETNLGNLLCDAMLWKTRDLGTTIALQNGGGIRAFVPAGEVTMGQILEVLPYGNQLTTVTVTGGGLLAALENGVSQVEEGAGRFPHVAGLRYTFDPAVRPGERVTEVELWDAPTGAYVPLDRTANYELVTNHYLAAGGDGYTMLAEPTNRYDTGWLLSDVLADYLREHASVRPTVEGRIERVATP